MGRYYTGDIEGKFWFAVQSSQDGEFFGAQEDKNYINYIVAEKDNQVKEGIEECLKELGNWKERLDQFFGQTNGYNNEMIVKYWKDEFHEVIPDDAIRRQLEWYARLRLGKQIQKYFDENLGRDCYFEAEL